MNERKELTGDLSVTFGYLNEERRQSPCEEFTRFSQEGTNVRRSYLYIPLIPKTFIALVRFYRKTSRS